MNKNLVKVAAVAAAAICALPMASAFSANAATKQVRYHVKQVSYGRLGDVNGGGLTLMDALDIRKYCNGTLASNSTFNKKVADVDNDGYITVNDADCIQTYLTNPKTGDANDDGVINLADSVAVTQFLYNDVKYSINNLLKADVNYDGIINTVDANLIRNKCLGIIDLFNVRWGDLNGDNKVNYNDATIVGSYFGQKWERKTISDDLFRRCDVNGDGKINLLDQLSIQNYVNGYGFTETNNY